MSTMSSTCILTWKCMFCLCCFFFFFFSVFLLFALLLLRSVLLCVCRAFFFGVWYISHLCVYRMRNVINGFWRASRIRQSIHTNASHSYDIPSMVLPSYSPLVWDIPASARPLTYNGTMPSQHFRRFSRSFSPPFRWYKTWRKQKYFHHALSYKINHGVSRSTHYIHICEIEKYRTHIPMYKRHTAYTRAEFSMYSIAKYNCRTIGFRFASGEVKIFYYKGGATAKRTDFFAILFFRVVVCNFVCCKIRCLF